MCRYRIISLLSKLNTDLCKTARYKTGVISPDDRIEENLLDSQVEVLPQGVHLGPYLFRVVGTTVQWRRVRIVQFKEWTGLEAK